MWGFQTFLELRHRFCEGVSLAEISMSEKKIICFEFHQLKCDQGHGALPVLTGFFFFI
jgi:hypothetical protein